jgi:hypothetical protein
LCADKAISLGGHNPPKALPDILCASSRKQLNNCERLPLHARNTSGVVHHGGGVEE